MTQISQCMHKESARYEHREARINPASVCRMLVPTSFHVEAGDVGCVPLQVLLITCFAGSAVSPCLAIRPCGEGACLTNLPLVDAPVACLEMAGSKQKLIVLIMSAALD